MTEERSYVKLRDLKAGDKVEFDGGFDCIKSGEHRTVYSSISGLYVDCGEGKHYLSGQLGLDDLLIGVYKVQP